MSGATSSLVYPLILQEPRRDRLATDTIRQFAHLETPPLQSHTAHAQTAVLLGRKTTSECLYQSGSTARTTRDNGRPPQASTPSNLLLGSAPHETQQARQDQPALIAEAR